MSSFHHMKCCLEMNAWVYIHYNYLSAYKNLLKPCQSKGSLNSWETLVRMWQVKNNSDYKCWQLFTACVTEGDSKCLKQLLNSHAEACFLLAATSNGLVVNLVNTWIKRSGTYWILQLKRQETKPPIQRQIIVFLHIDYLDRKQDWIGKNLEMKSLETGETYSNIYLGTGQASWLVTPKPAGNMQASTWHETNTFLPIFPRQAAISPVKS